jgi:FixJ family two-component response regulator
VAQRLQSLGLDGIPLIFITGSKLAGLKETAESLGAVAFFEKPYDSRELLDVISQTLEFQEPDSRMDWCGNEGAGAENDNHSNPASIRKRF